MRVVCVTVIAALLLAGCSSSVSSTSSSEEAAFAGLQGKADDGKGILRCIVVDSAIRPIAHAFVQLRGAVKLSSNTTDTGACLFNNLEPGTYFLSVSKAGFHAGQQSAEVKAGEPAPPIVKVVMEPDPTTRPFFQIEKWNGYMECGLSVIALCGATEVGGLKPTQDNFAHVVPIERTPNWLQSEMVWKTTTAASDQMWLWHSLAKPGSGAYNGSKNWWVQGVSPIVMISNASMIKAVGYGTNNWLYLRVFTGSIDGTRNPLNPEHCYPGPPAGDIYCGGVGYSVEQPFTVFTHSFFGFDPPPGYQFSKDGNPKTPA